MLVALFLMVSVFGINFHSGSRLPPLHLLTLEGATFGSSWDYNITDHYTTVPYENNISKVESLCDVCKNSRLHYTRA